MLQVGATVGRYVIEGVLGEGGMGRVYRARDPSLGRLVALKLLITDGDARTDDAHAEAAARMLREARAAAAFSHPNVVAIYDVGDFQGSPFIAMELVSGATLRGLVGAVGAGDVPEAQKVRLLLDVARGLEAAHRAGLVHRDIKPDNVMVTTDGVVKILDFGIARSAETGAVDGLMATQAASLEPLTAEGLAIGTPHYMSPEQLRAAPLDGRCDEYAWGVMAYELLSGALPWRGRTGAQLIAAVLDGAVPPLREVVPSIDPRVSDVVARAMQRERGDRFATMRELCDALAPESVSAQVPVVIRTGDVADASAPTTAQPVAAAGASASSPPAPAVPAIGARRRGTLLSVGAALLALIALGCVVTWGVVHRLGASRPLYRPDVALLGPLPAVRSDDPISPWEPPPDGELHLWSAGRDHGYMHSDVGRYCRPFLDTLQRTYNGVDYDKVHAAWLATPTAGLPPAQVEFCLGPKALAFGRVELPVVGTVNEGLRPLLQIGKNAGVVATDRLVRGEPPFCPSARRVPATLPAPGVRVETRPSDWADDPGWSCLQFALTTPTTFQYDFESTGTGAKASARAFLEVGPRLLKVTATVTGSVVGGQLVGSAIEVQWEADE